MAGGPGTTRAGHARQDAATGAAGAHVVRLEPLPGAVGTGAHQAIDGERLLGAAVDFGRRLRRAGLAIDLGAVIDFGRSLELVGLADRELVREAGAAVFVRRREERERYDAVFDGFWGRRPAAAPLPVPTRIVDDRESDPPDEREERAARGADERPDAPEQAGRTAPADPRGTEDAPPADEVEALTISPQAWSHDRLDRDRQFDRMTASELREAERFVDLLSPRLERRRTRRRELHPRGRILATRATLRRNLQTGGAPIRLAWQRPIRRPRRLVVLCDISGSMERHGRLLLRFSQALAASAVRTEAFVFGTRLTRVTRLLRARDRDAALAAVAEATADWSGGTRIGECLHEFNRRWARRTLPSSAVVVIVSDGWDRGDPALVQDEMARLQRRCHRLIWLNPLASAEGYRPLAAGMAAALPHVDDFVPAGNLASLERLAELLASRDERGRPVRGTRPTRSPGRAATSARIVGAAGAAREGTR